MKVLKYYFYAILAIVLILSASLVSCHEIRTNSTSHLDFSQWIEGETDMADLEAQQAASRQGHFPWRLDPEEVVVEYGYTDKELRKYFSEEYELIEITENEDSYHLVFSFKNGRQITFIVYQPFESGAYGIYAVKKYMIV